MGYIKDIKFLLLASTVIFGLAFFFGFLTGDYLHLVDHKRNLNPPIPGLELAIKLFTNNVIICLVLISGIFMFGLPTIFLLLFNGFFLGVGVKSLILIGLDRTEIFLKLFPHGILEIPALLLSASVGFLGITFYFYPKKKYLKTMFKLMILVVFLVFVAAIIEGFITVTL